jgi:type IV secretory pathway VirB4 component
MGKSFFMKSLLARSHLLRNERIFLLDPNGEYRLMTDYLDGIYISRQRGGFSVNPFDLYYSEEFPISKAIDSAAARIKALVNTLIIESLSSVEVAILEMAIYETYKKFGWSREGEKEGKDFPTLLDLVEVLESEAMGERGEAGGNISLRLVPYSRGTFSEYFAKKTSFDIKNNFVAIDYTNIPKEIKAVLTIIDFSMIMEKVKQDKIRTKLVIDEGWDILRTDAGSDLVLEAVKTGRKFNLSVVFATQDVQDVARDKGGQTLLQNAVIKFITTQTEAGLPVVQEVFNLSNRESRILQGAGIGGGLLIVDTEKFPMRVIASELEKKLFESNPLKMAEQEKLLKEEKDRREREKVAKEAGIDFIGVENSGDIESL